MSVQRARHLPAVCAYTGQPAEQTVRLKATHRYWLGPNWLVLAGGGIPAIDVVPVLLPLTRRARLVHRILPRLAWPIVAALSLLPMQTWARTHDDRSRLPGTPPPPDWPPTIACLVAIVLVVAAAAWFWRRVTLTDDGATVVLHRVHPAFAAKVRSTMPLRHPRRRNTVVV